MYRIAINGFGRIGKNIARALLNQSHNKNDIEIVAINDLGCPKIHSHLLKYDSVHGVIDKSITSNESSITVDGHEILFLSSNDPSALPWRELNIDLVLECTGHFTERDNAAKHINAGAKKVIISAPSPDVEKTIVYGVNHQILNSDDVIISNASCTTNCLAPIAKVLHETVGIKRGFMTTVHSYTGDQPVLDTMHNDLYRARAASLSMIPTTTGAAKAVGLVLPELSGRLDGFAVRVPTPNVSVVDLTFEANRDTSITEINEAVNNVASSTLKGVLGYTDKKLVSCDFNHDPRSSIFAADQTKVMDKTLVRVLSWYDNEWGFSNRMADTAMVMAKHI